MALRLILDSTILGLMDLANGRDQLSGNSGAVFQYVIFTRRIRLRTPDIADLENDHDKPRLSDSTLTSKIDYLAKPELKATRTSIITGGCRETRNQRAVLKGVGEALS